MNVVSKPAVDARVNDFTIKVATVNGTGSSSANTLLMKSIFRSGVPVVGKNLFPSNIQGLPTWYEIRVTKDGYQAPTGSIDLMVAMNGETYAKDLKEVCPGGYLIYDSSWPRPKLLERHDVTVIGIPLARMCNEHFSTARVRVLMKNMAYVGAVAALVDLDLGVIRSMIEDTFAAKPKLIDANMEAINLGYDYIREEYDCPLPLRIEKMDETKGHIMIDGNTAAGLGCVYAGATVGAWYPITPSTSLMDAFKVYCDRFRIDKETGVHNYCIIQAEDELASAGMVVGAAWAGARAFTPTSGPGISLMSEFIGFAYYSEVPMVLFDVQRVGPSTGMPTRTQQGDILLAAYASHGDTKHIVLFPADPHECFEMAVEAFELAEMFQTPVFVLSDLDIGMNDWMIPTLDWDDNWVPHRGKVLGPEDLKDVQKFHRYLDKDGDGIPYRTLPGESPKGAYFTRGSGHNKYGGYTEDSAEYQDVLDRLLVKFDTAKANVPQPILTQADKKTPLGIISVGSCDGAVKEALDVLAEHGVIADYLRVRAFPFNGDVLEFVEGHETVFVVEQNRDAQMRTLLINEACVDPKKLIPVLKYDGMSPDRRFIVDGVNAYLAGARS